MRSWLDPSYAVAHQVPLYLPRKMRLQIFDVIQVRNEGKKCSENSSEKLSSQKVQILRKPICVDATFYIYQRVSTFPVMKIKGTKKSVIF